MQSPGEINVMIVSQPGCNNSIRHFENRFRHILFYFVFNAVWALTSGGFRIVSDTLVYNLPSTTEEVYVFARAPAFVCLCARLLKNACMGLDEMLRVDRCRNMDELINF